MKVQWWVFKQAIQSRYLTWCPVSPGMAAWACAAGFQICLATHAETFGIRMPILLTDEDKKVERVLGC